MATKVRISKKAIVIIVIAVVFAVLLALVLFYLSVRSTDRDATFRNPELSFAEADYDTNILADPFYLRYNRDIMFTEYGNGELVTAENFKQMGVWAEFFHNYFATVINGDYNKYPQYFTETYLKEHDLPERFTMQRIYDIDVELFSRDSIEYNGANVLRSRYVVTYHIQYNNGTFRGDITGNDLRPLLFTLIEDNGRILIDSITQINYRGA